MPSPTILSTDQTGRVAAPIFASVGSDAVNGPGDVFVIQSLLNDRLPQPHVPIDTTGVMDPGTILAIKVYQAAIMGMNPPTGHIDPASATYYALAARPLLNPAQQAAIHFGHVGVVPPEVRDAAVASFARWRVPTAVTLAQWVVESAWGAATPPDSNNPFGIKAAGSQPWVDAPTREVIAGASVTTTGRFRKFDSISQAFDEHGKLLATQPVYAPAMQRASDPDAFADALTGVYATDPNYGSTLKWVMTRYDFGDTALR